jgi:hypothetical protein
MLNPSQRSSIDPESILVPDIQNSPQKPAPIEQNLPPEEAALAAVNSAAFKLFTASPKTMQNFSKKVLQALCDRRNIIYQSKWTKRVLVEKLFLSVSGFHVITIVGLFSPGKPSATI